MKEKDAKGERYDAFLNGKLSICEELLGCIDSFQQEPRFPQYDNIVEKVFGAGNLDGWERDEAEILVALAKEELLKSLQQEQPSLPSNIDEAAEEYSENILANNEDLQDAIEDAFKEGAKWMAEQGETKQGVVTKDDFIQFADDTYIDLDPKLELTPAFALKDAKEVIVQIRKKQ